MGTRSVVELIRNGARVALYRHWDGYLAVGGAALAEELEKGQSLESVLEGLLHRTSINGSRDYEITSKAEDHGDLEHIYEVHWPDYGTSIKIVHKAGCSWAEWEEVSYTLPEFKAMIQEEKAAFERRNS